MRSNPTSKSPKPLLSVEEAAVLLGETRSTLYRSIKAGTFPLPIFRIGRRIRIPRRSVERCWPDFRSSRRRNSVWTSNPPEHVVRDQPDR